MLFQLYSGFYDDSAVMRKFSDSPIGAGSVDAGELPGLCLVGPVLQGTTKCRELSSSPSAALK